jgi:starvation-inducible DNA-binding protein
MKIAIGLTEPHAEAVAAQLAKLLADEFVLYIKTRNAHWNVEGPDFQGLHLLFESQFGQLDDLIDDIAEKIRSLGHYAPGTLKGILELTHLTEHSSFGNSGKEYIKLLLEDHSSIIVFLRENIDGFAANYKDFGSSDLLTAAMALHEKMAWMLRSFLQ